MSVPKKEHISFRIDGSCLDKLHVEAKQNNVALNVLVNQIIKQYLEWHLPCIKSGTMPLLKSVVREILNRVDDDVLSSAGVKIATTEFRQMIMMFRNEFTLPAWIQIFEDWMKMSGFQFTHEIENNSHHIIVRHDMGKKFSFFTKELLKNIFDQFNVKTNFEITDNVVSILIYCD